MAEILLVARSANDGGENPPKAVGANGRRIVLVETAHETGPWLAGGFPSARGLDPQVEAYSGPDRPFGGLHRGMMQVLWVDASVRPVSDGTPGSVFRSQATLRRAEP